MFSAIARFFGFGFLENFVSFVASHTSENDDPEVDDESNLEGLDLDFTNDYGSEQAVSYCMERLIGRKDRKCLRFTPETSTCLPTFSFRHNEMSFTDDYEEVDELMKKVLTGYAGVEEGVEIHSDDNGAPKYEADEAEPSKREVKIRDFATEHPIPTVFNAHRKALHFHYLRYLSKHHVFDFPVFSFTPEDAHRLHVCGFLKPEDWKGCFLLTAMLGVGAYKCHRRVNPLDPHAKLLPPRGPWTISANSRPPTPEEITDFIFDVEYSRYFGHVGPYAFEASERAGLTVGYIEHRILKHGVLGLERAGIDDKEAMEVVLIPDKTYIPPRRFNRDSWIRHPGDKHCCYCTRDGGNKPKESLMLTYPVLPAPAEPDSSDLAQSGSTPPPEPETPEPDSTSKSGVGKKRARSFSPEGAEDRPSRSKRVRLLAKEPDVPVGPDIPPLSITSVAPPFDGFEVDVIG